MAKIEKLIERLLSKPVDFTWEETIKILEVYGDLSKTTPLGNYFSNDFLK